MKRPVTMSMRDEDLERLDAFAKERRLSRGDAVGVLLEWAPRADLQEVVETDIHSVVTVSDKLARARQALLDGEAGKGARLFNEPPVVARKPARIEPEDESQDPGDY